jgi:hypothetical protein
VVKANATINVAPPYQNGSKVFTSIVGMTGTIDVQCGEGLVTGLVVTVEDAKGESQIYPPAPVATDGSFAIAVGLDWGVNKLKFETYVGSNKISNNMEDIDFTLDRVPHCLKDGSTLSLPTSTATGIPLFWMSTNPGIASVDSTGHVLTANSDGWAWIYANVGTVTVVRAVGVSSVTNYVPTLPGDPFYQPERVSPWPPPAALLQILDQVSNHFAPERNGVGYRTPWSIGGSDLNGKYWVGSYMTSICPVCINAYYIECRSGDPDCEPGWRCIEGIPQCKSAAFLYDGISFIP